MWLYRLLLIHSVVLVQSLEFTFHTHIYTVYIIYKSMVWSTLYAPTWWLPGSSLLRPQTLTVVKCKKTNDLLIVYLNKCKIRLVQLTGFLFKKKKKVWFSKVCETTTQNWTFDFFECLLQSGNTQEEKQELLQKVYCYLPRDKFITSFINKMRHEEMFPKSLHVYRWVQ